MMLVSILIYLLILEKPNGFIIGLIYGVLGGIRNEAMLFFPAVIYKLFTSSDRKAKEVILCILGASITIAPILYWNYYAFGNPLMHPTQFPGLGGFRPVFEHRFLFWKFNFNGMLNYPLHNKIIRTPYFSFPVFLLLPLTLISSFGILGFTLIFSGAINLFKKQRRVFIFLMLWFIPMYLLLSVQENWSNLKMTFLLMIINPLIIFIISGIEEFYPSKRVTINISRIALLSASLFIAVKLLSYLNFNVDERWYMRFPRAIKGANISYIGDDLRTEREDAAELIVQKKILTRGNLFPVFYKSKINISDKIKNIQGEMRQREITVVDFWKYIYEK